LTTGRSFTHCAWWIQNAVFAKPARSIAPKNELALGHSNGVGSPR
jgi:hypothetical protein